MGNRAVRRNQQQIDPMFFIPDGVDELVYTDRDRELSGQYEEGDDAIEEFFLTDDDFDFNEPPDTPTIVGIVLPQVVRTSSTGNEVVDVTFEVEDIDGLLYEIRFVPL